MANADPHIPIGSRVQLSALGKSRSPKLSQKNGTVVAYNATGGTARVRFDGALTETRIHQSYLEVVPVDDPAP